MFRTQICGGFMALAVAGCATADNGKVVAVRTAPEHQSKPAPQPVGVTVTGAPGNGNAALAAALQPLIGKGGVRGDVTVSKPVNGQQTVTIVWTAPAGQVTQTKTVPAGNLDAEWGSEAIAVANSAAPGIVKLLAMTP